MLYREDLEKREEFLAPGAARSAASKGREFYEEPCGFGRIFKETGTELFIRRHFGG